MPSRRAFVVAVAIGLAGCTATPGRDTESQPHDRQTSTGGSTPGHGDGCTAGFHVTLEAFEPSDDLPMHVDGPAERELVATLVDEGETTRGTYGDATLGDGVVAHDGTYYWLDASSAGVEEVPAYLFDISWENGRTAPEDATLLAYDDLPESDREALAFLVHPGEREDHPTQSLSGRERPVPYPGGGDQSTLLEYDTVWVRWNDREYRLSPGGRTTTDRRRYRYTAQEIAGSDDDLRAWAADRFLVELSATDSQRDLLDAASTDYHEECSPASDALAGLREQLPEDKRLPQPADGWYVEYDGDRYRLQILQWVE